MMTNLVEGGSGEQHGFVFSGVVLFAVVCLTVCGECAGVYVLPWARATKTAIHIPSSTEALTASSMKREVWADVLVWIYAHHPRTAPGCSGGILGGNCLPDLINYKRAANYGVPTIDFAVFEATMKRGPPQQTATLYFVISLLFPSSCTTIASKKIPTPELIADNFG